MNITKPSSLRWGHSLIFIDSPAQGVPLDDEGQVKVAMSLINIIIGAWIILSGITIELNPSISEATIHEAKKRIRRQGK